MTSARARAQTRKRVRADARDESANHAARAEPAGSGATERCDMKPREMRKDPMRQRNAQTRARARDLRCHT